MQASFHVVFSDVISQLLQSAATPGQKLSVHVGRGLRHIFPPPEPLEIWYLRVRIVGDVVSVVYAEGASIVGAQGRSLPPDIVEMGWSRWGRPALEHRQTQTSALLPDPNNPQALALVQRRTVSLPQGEVRMIEQWWVVPAQHDAPTMERLKSLGAYYQGQTQILNAVRALRAVRHYSDVARRVTDLTTRTSLPIRQRLEDANQLLIELLTELSDGLSVQYLNLVETLAIWALQELLGSGWGVRNIGGREGKKQLREMALNLERLALPELALPVVQRLPTESRQEQAAPLPRLRGLAAMLGSLAGDDGPYQRLEIQELCDSESPALGLLIVWTRLHEATRVAELSMRGWSTALDEMWQSALQLTLPALARLLSAAQVGQAPEVSFARNWLRLWFCHVLLTEDQPGTDVPLTTQRRFKVGLAYVLRESLRVQLYGDRGDFHFQPAAFAATLRTLVDHHAVHVVGLPRQLDIVNYLFQIGDSPLPENYQFAAGHLQHVLELYIAGHFLGAIELSQPGSPWDGWTLAEVLARGARTDDRPLPEVVQDFRQSFSLAVFFHDIGMVLFPNVQDPAAGLLREDQLLQAELRTTGASVALKELGIRLVDRCIDELRAHLASDPPLSAWVQAQRYNGQPDHALLGAWYLQRIGRSAAEPSILEPAVRAVLLHAAVVRHVSVEQDPVAALLMLCDELFEWLPNIQRRPSPNSVGTTPYALAVDVRPFRSRAERLRIRHLHILPPTHHTEAVRAVLQVPAHERNFWPHIELRLHHQEFLDQTVHAIWLAIAQNLTRIQPAANGWGPAVTIVNQVPARLRDLRMGTGELLSEVATVAGELPTGMRGALESWLAEAEITQTTEDGEQLERLKIAPTGRPLYDHDLRPMLGQLDSAARTVLRRIEEQSREEE